MENGRQHPALLRRNRQLRIIRQLFYSPLFLSPVQQQWRPMADSTRLRILYVGRKAQFADYLQTLFERQNQIGTARPERGSSRRAKKSTRPEWPAVLFSSVTNQKAALQLIRTQPPAVVIVELEQKPTSRQRFCEIIRYRLPTAAILALAAKLPAQSAAFDGHIKLPFVDEEIATLICTLGRKHTEHELQHGPIVLNIANRTVTTPNGQYTMTPKQCALLKLFMLQHDQVVKRSKIMENVWETSYLDDTRTLDVHIRWLRERIEADPSNPVFLKTVRGVGYRFSTNGHGE